MNSTIVSITAETFETPLHRSFSTSQGSTNVARGVAILLALGDGKVVRGESVPVKYVTGETQETVIETVQKVAPSLIGLSIENYRSSLNIIASFAPGSPSARCGLEMAILESWSQLNGVSLARMLGGATNSAESDITISIDKDAPELAKFAFESGFKILKIKVGGGDLETEIHRVLSVVEAAPEATLRIDANQAFSREDAVSFAIRLFEAGVKVQLLEQPVPKEDFEGLDFVAQRSPIPVFADESCQSLRDALRLVTQTQIQGLNLKTNKCGLWGVVEIISIAKAAGKKIMLGCMLETRRSIAASLEIVCGTGAFDYVDLDSHLLLNEAGANEFFEQNGSIMRLKESGD